MLAPRPADTGVQRVTGDATCASNMRRAAIWLIIGLHRVVTTFLSLRRGIAFSLLASVNVLGPERRTPPGLGSYEDLDRFRSMGSHSHAARCRNSAVPRWYVGALGLPWDHMPRAVTQRPVTLSSSRDHSIARGAGASHMPGVAGSILAFLRAVLQARLMLTYRVSVSWFQNTWSVPR